MRPLAAEEVLTVWELGERVDPLDRALMLLSAGDPTHVAPADLPLGERDARLLELRARTLGPKLPIFATCPFCSARYEFELDARAVLEGHRPTEESEWEVQSGEFVIRYRLVCSGDLAAISSIADSAEARRALGVRCIREARRHGLEVEATQLPEAVFHELARAMEERDPLAEVPLALECSDCGRGWQPRLDIADFFWTEIRTMAQRLIADVAALARAYGWREADILAMSARRRRAYLEVGAG